MHYTVFFSCSFSTWELALSAERHAKGDQGKQLNINQCQIMHSACTDQKSPACGKFITLLRIPLVNCSPVTYTIRQTSSSSAYTDKWT